MLPGMLSATKRSPLGAVTITRGLRSLVANSVTLKPSGALGQAPSGRGTTLRSVVDRLGLIGRGKIGRRELAANAGRIRGPVPP